MILDTINSGATLVSDTYLAAGIPQLLLRDRTTMRVPVRAIGAGIEAASIGARAGVFMRRIDALGLDLDLNSCYAVANALGGVQDLLTHQVVAHRLTGGRRLAQLMRTLPGPSLDPLRHPAGWRAWSFLAKIRANDDILTQHVALFDREATVTAPVVAGSVPLWMTGFDLVSAMIEDLDRGGPGKVPEVTAAWVFEIGPRLRGLQPVPFPGGWVWDPRRDARYRSRDGKTWGHLSLMLAAMREAARTDPELSPATRARRRGMLKVATVAGAFGLWSSSYGMRRAAGKPHRVITADGIVTVPAGTPERPGPWAFPPGAALVEGAGRLLLTLVLHEVRSLGGTVVQADTDGAFVLATPDGGVIDMGALG